MGVLGRKLMDAPVSGITTTAAFVSNANENVSVSGDRTFSGMSIGAADADRYIVACVYVFRIVAISEPSLTVTIGGVSADLVVSGGGTNASPAFATYCYIYIAKVPSGTTADVVIGSGGVTLDSRAVALYRMIRSDATETDSGANSDSGVNVSVVLSSTAASGVIIAVNGNSNGANPTVTAGGLLEDVSVDIRSNEWFATAMKENSTSGSQTITFNTTTDPGVQALAVAHWS